MMRAVIVIAACLAIVSGLPSIVTADPSPVSNGTDINVNCDQLKKMHHSMVRAKVAYNCPEKPTNDAPTDCDRQLLTDLSSCSSADSQYCFFQLIAQKEVCFPGTTGSEEACNDAQGGQLLTVCTAGLLQQHLLPQRRLWLLEDPRMLRRTCGGCRSLY